jgi:hypothetical protein
MTKTISQLDYEENKAKYELEIHRLQKENLILSNEVLKDYRYTKWFARVSIVLSLSLALLELIKFLK